MVILIIGGLAGTAVDVSLFPLDTIKTRLQSKYVQYTMVLRGCILTKKKYFCPFSFFQNDIFFPRYSENFLFIPLRSSSFLLYSIKKKKKSYFPPSQLILHIFVGGGRQNEKHTPPCGTGFFKMSSGYHSETLSNPAAAQQYPMAPRPGFEGFFLL